MATHSSVPAWRIPGGSPVGCRLWGRTESDTTEATEQQQQSPFKFGPTCLIFQVALVVRNLHASGGDIGDMGFILGSGRSSGGGHGDPLQ